MHCRAHNTKKVIFFSYLKANTALKSLFGANSMLKKEKEIYFFNSSLIAPFNRGTRLENRETLEVMVFREQKTSITDSQILI